MQVSLTTTTVKAGRRKYRYRQLRWRDKHGVRRCKSLGDIKKREAIEEKNKLIAELEQQKLFGSPKLGQFLTTYLYQRQTEIKPSTHKLYATAANLLHAHFGDIDTQAITPEKARAFKAAVAHRTITLPAGPERLIKIEHAGRTKETSVSAHWVCLICRSAKTMFAQLHDDGTIPVNPFRKLASPPRTTEKDWHYCTPDELNALLKHCSKPFGIFLALCRYAGLRQGEALKVRWCDINLSQGNATLTINAEKTGQKRIVPISPELATIIANNTETLPVLPTEYAASLSRNNLRRTFLETCAKANVKPWPKWCHTLRKNREQDWNRDFPFHVVCAWMGHSPEVAQRHYLKVDAESIAKANEQTANKSPSILTQNMTQTPQTSPNSGGSKNA